MAKLYLGEEFAVFLFFFFFMDGACDDEEYYCRLELTFLDRTIFYAYKIRFPIPPRCRYFIVTRSACMHACMYARTRADGYNRACSCKDSADLGRISRDSLLIWPAV